MSKSHHGNFGCKVFLLAIVWGVVLSGCNSRETEASSLRITNNGSISISNLVVLFPEESIVFGNVPPGTTTEYKEVPNGVFSYAAYQYEVDGQAITQPVIDWVGESPLKGTKFTYTIDFDPSRFNSGDRIRLISIKNDD